MSTAAAPVRLGNRLVNHVKDLCLSRPYRADVEKTEGGATVPGNWAADAVTPGAAEFMEKLRPRTIIGRLPRLRSVPFRLPVVKRTGGGLYAWRGEGGSKTVTSAEYDKTTLKPRTAAGIIVLSRELLAASDTETDILRELSDGLTAFLDSSFIDPAAALIPDVQPGSVTNGASSIPSSGDPGDDLRALVAAVEAALGTLADVAIVMSETSAWGIATTLPGAFPLGVAGGLFGLLPVVLSASAADNLVAVHAPSVLIGEGPLRLDRATETALEMAGNPATGAANLVSLFQTNSVALRAERMTNWEVARAGAVQYVAGADYGGPTS